MQHKYNAKQMLFVKNVPRDSATRVENLFTKYKPLETKNLYPTSQITTLMIALPSIGATEAALGKIDGVRINNTVVSVERYNPKQSTVARRDARKKPNNLPNGRADHDYNDEEDYGGYDGNNDGHEEARTSTQTSKATKLMAKRPEPEPEPRPRTRRVSESGGVSWAGLVGGKQAKKHSPSPAPSSTSVQAVTPQERPDAARSTSMAASPQRQSPPHIFLTPATASIGPCPVVPDPLFTDSYMSFDDFYCNVLESRTPLRHTQTQNGESSRVDKDSSRSTQALVTSRVQRRIFCMPINTTSFIKRRHCADCAFCRMRDQSQARRDRSDH